MEKTTKLKLELKLAVIYLSLITAGSLSHINNNSELEIQDYKQYHKDINYSKINILDIDCDTLELGLMSASPRDFYNAIDSHKYSGMSISNELEEYIKHLCSIYGVPYEIILTIGNKESGGKWNTTGVISCTNDYGLFQINACNLDFIKANLGYTKDQILYNDCMNAEACIYLVKLIMEREDVSSIEEVYGMYNGWSNWRNIQSSVSYVSSCIDIMDSYFPGFSLDNPKYLSYTKTN